MKITPTTRFPWPVLWSETDDYVAEGFSGAITRIEEDHATGELTYEYKFEIGDESVATMVKDGGANIGIYVTCINTMFNELRKAPATEGSDTIPPGRLRGALSFTPVCWATAGVKNFTSGALHEEYRGTCIDLPPRALMAIGEPTTFYVGSEKAVAIGSIFEIAVHEEQEDFEFGLQLDGDNIVILCNEKTKRIVDGHRATSAGQALMLNALYLPVLVQVLIELKSRDDQAAQPQWARVLSAKIEASGKVLNDDCLQLAQELLEAPFRYLEKVEARGVP